MKLYTKYKKSKMKKHYSSLYTVTVANIPLEYTLYTVEEHTELAALACRPRNNQT